MHREGILDKSDTTTSSNVISESSPQAQTPNPAMSCGGGANGCRKMPAKLWPENRDDRNLVGKDHGPLRYRCPGPPQALHIVFNLRVAS